MASIIDQGALTSKVSTTTFLERTDFEKLEDLSRETGAAISHLIRKAVKDYLMEQESLIKLKREKGNP